MTAAVALSSLVAIGEVLAGKYRVESIIGEGGMGVVVCAMHLQLEQRVAVKFLRPDVLRDEQVTARFSREAKAAAKIRSEHVARVLDVGVLENGAPYMVMEYLEGKDLRQTIREGGPLQPEDAARYVLQACEALAEAHAVGIIHRDLKPANLFLAQQPGGEVKVKILDFGISKDIDATVQGLTHSHSLMGTPYYMSPEQLTSPKDVDPRTDIWSLGIILFELLAGQPPYRGSTLPEVVASVLRSAPPSHRLPDQVPSSIRKVIDRCLVHALRARYQNVGELVADLAEVCPLQGQTSNTRIRRVLQLVTDAPAAALQSTLSSDDPTHAGAISAVRTSDEPPAIRSGAPTKLERLPGEETINSWQAPSVSGKTNAAAHASARRRYILAISALSVALASVLVGARIMQSRGSAPAQANVAPLLTNAPAHTEAAPVPLREVPPAPPIEPSAIASASSRAVKPTPIGAVNPSHTGAPAASSARATSPKPPPSAPPNPLNIGIQ